MRDQEEPKKRAKKRLPRSLRSLPASPALRVMQVGGKHGSSHSEQRVSNRHSSFSKRRARRSPKGRERVAKAFQTSPQSPPNKVPKGRKQGPSKGRKKGPKKGWRQALACLGTIPAYCPDFVGADAKELQGHLVGAHGRGTSAGGGGRRRRRTPPACEGLRPILKDASSSRT